MKKFMLIPIMAMIAAVLSFASPSAALRPTPPCGLNCTAPTTTTTVAPGPTYQVIPCGYLTQDWVEVHNINPGDTVSYCGATYIIPEPQVVCTIPSVSLIGIRANRTYSQPHKFNITVDHNVDATRYRMRVFDENGVRVKTQNRFVNRANWGRDFRLNKLAPGSYHVEIRIFFANNKCQSHWDIGFWVTLT